MNILEKEQLITEVNTLRLLRHPHIVRYHERYIDKEKQIIYIFMEYCQYGDLTKLIQQAKQQQ